MGAVTIDTKRNEREFENITLSDRNAVKYLILYRSHVDVVYGANTNININQAGDIFEFNQELIALFASLDNIIDKINLNEKENRFLKLIFEGNTIADIINIYKLYPKKTAYRTLNKIIDSILQQNFLEWKRVLNNSILGG